MAGITATLLNSMPVKKGDGATSLMPVAIFEMDGGTYLTTIALNAKTMAQESQLWKFKSAKAGFALVQTFWAPSTKTAPTLPDSQLMFPADHGALSSASMTIGKDAYLLGARKKLYPFKQSSDPILKKLGKQLSITGAITLPKTGIYEDFYSNNFAFYMKCGAQELFINPTWNNGTNTINGSPGAALMPAIGVYNFVSKTGNITPLQKLETLLSAIGAPEGDNTKCSNTFVDKTLNFNSPTTSQYAYLTRPITPSFNFQIQPVDTGYQYLVTTNIGDEHYKDAKKLDVGSFSNLRIWKYDSKLKMFNLNGCTAVTSWKGLKDTDGNTERGVVKFCVIPIKKQLAIYTIEYRINNGKYKWGVYCFWIDPEAKPLRGSAPQYILNKDATGSYTNNSTLIMDLTDKISQGYFMTGFSCQATNAAANQMVATNVKNKPKLWLCMNKKEGSLISFELEEYDIDTKNPAALLVAPTFSKSIPSKYTSTTLNRLGDAKAGWFAGWYLGPSSTVRTTKDGTFYTVLNSDEVDIYSIK